jgi:hypothetical protein
VKWLYRKGATTFKRRATITSIQQSCSLPLHNLNRGHGSRKSLHSDRLHPGWALKAARAPAAPLLSFSRNLCGHSGGELEYDHPYPPQFSPATPMYYFLTSLSFTDLCHSLSLPPKCWRTLWQRRTPSPTLNVWLSSTFSSILLFQNVTCWLQWPMIAMLPSVAPCFII